MPASEIGDERLQEFYRALDPETLSIVRAAPVGDLLVRIFTGSPFLTQLIASDPGRFAGFLHAPPDASFAALTNGLRSKPFQTRSEIKQALRRYKAAVALLTALSDLGRVWRTEEVTRVLSLAADTAVELAVNFLFREAVQKGEWLAPAAEAAAAGSGYFAVAMGKHGAFELNYSSDIDLVIFFDRDKAAPHVTGDVQTFFVRLTRALVEVLQERTADGYVFRTDLRLRPDAGATQIALSTAAAYSYYETAGQNWERAAWIKARVCAGDMQAGDAFLSGLAPFIWRRFLDYAQIADIHAMKRQIHAYKGIGPVSAAGQNVKLGRGGIREIEFFAQTQQLIAGGRQSDLRVRGTEDALSALSQRNWISSRVRDELSAAYRLLRDIEHRLQMVADEQTHTMPETEEELERFALFAGYQSASELAATLTATLQTVERHYSNLFEGEPPLTRANKDMVFAGASDDPATMQELARLGFSQPSQVLGIVRGWHHGRWPVMRSARARERLTEVQPYLIPALADTLDPDGAIAEFDRFLSGLPAGVQLFALLKANPALLKLFADIMGSAPRLARMLSKRRRLLDAVLDARGFDAALTSGGIDAAIASEFAAARTKDTSDPMQDILDASRIAGGELQFLTGLRVLAGTLEADEAGPAYSLIAERLLAALFKEVSAEFEDAHGTCDSGEAVIVALGKLGSREMTAASDLDIILIYDVADGAELSNGARPLAPSHYYARLTQRLVSALTAPTGEGVLYEVDLRLRPSGNKGPVATRYSSFVAYQASEAWTWEHMALTRARVVAGSPGLARRVTEAIASVLRQPRDATKIARDCYEMRALIDSNKPASGAWDLKQARGGLVDLEFIVQYLQLVSAAKHPEILRTGTLAAVTALSEANVLSPADSRILIEGGRFLHALTQLLRLCLDGPFDSAKAPAGLKARLIGLGRLSDFDGLDQRLKQTETDIFVVFSRIIGAAATEKPGQSR